MHLSLALDYPEGNSIYWVTQSMSMKMKKRKKSAGTDFTDPGIQDSVTYVVMNYSSK